MRIDNDTVSFDNADTHFVKRFGIEEATDMVLNYSVFNKTPFIYDIMNLEKRECPIKIKLTPCSGYYLSVEFEINGEKHRCCPSANGW